MQIETVKHSGDGYLVNGYISVPKADGNKDYKAVLEWIDNGGIISPEFTASQLADQAVVQAKQDMQEALATMTVTTLSGNTFDADDTARQDMLSALREGEISGEIEYPFWKLADNSFLTPCTFVELEEAHGLAIRRKGEILAGQ